MAEPHQPSTPTQSERPRAAGPHERRHRETATDRRSRQTAEAITALRDLKAEAAERRARKSGS